MRDISRRSFLGWTAVGAAGLLAPQEEGDGRRLQLLG